MTAAQIDRLLGRRFRMEADGEDVDLTISAFDEHGAATCRLRNAVPVRQTIPGAVLLASIRAGILVER